MFGRATITLSIGPHSSLFYTAQKLKLIILFRGGYWAESSYSDSSHYYDHNRHHSMQHSFVIFFLKLL